LFSLLIEEYSEDVEELRSGIVRLRTEELTTALFRVVSEIFNVEKCPDLEIWIKGHSRSLKVVPFGRSCEVSY